MRDVKSELPLRLTARGGEDGWHAKIIRVVGMRQAIVRQPMVAFVASAGVGDYLLGHGGAQSALVVPLGEIGNTLLTEQAKTQSSLTQEGDGMGQGLCFL